MQEFFDYVEAASARERSAAAQQIHATAVGAQGDGKSIKQALEALK